MAVYARVGLLLHSGGHSYASMEGNAAVCSLLTYLKRDTTRPLTEKQIQDFYLEVLPQPPHSHLAPSDFHLFCPLKRRSARRSLQTARRSRGGGTRVAGTRTKRRFLPRNVCLSGTLKQVQNVVGTALNFDFFKKINHFQ